MKAVTFDKKSIVNFIVTVYDFPLYQTYLQSTSVRIEEMRMKRRDAEQWMTHRLLPENLRERIRRYEQYKWQETRGVNEESLLESLPKDLRREIKRHLCLSLLMRVFTFFFKSITCGVWPTKYLVFPNSGNHRRCTTAHSNQ